jgi:hypothetical protein
MYPLPPMSLPCSAMEYEALESFFAIDLRILAFAARKANESIAEVVTNYGHAG